MKRVTRGRLPIETVKESSVVADGVNGPELRRIQKSPGSHRIHYHEIADFGVTEAERCLFRRCSEGAVRADQRSEWLLTESGSRLGVHNQAGFITEFCGLCAGD